MATWHRGAVIRAGRRNGGCLGRCRGTRRAPALRLMKRLNMRLVILVWLVAATPALGAENALLLRVTPSVTSAPATASITVTVERNEQNRVLVIEDDSDLYYRSSQVQLDGDKAARTHLLVFRGLPPGEHRVSAVVHGTNGLRARVSRTVMVVGLGVAE